MFGNNNGTNMFTNSSSNMFQSNQPGHGSGMFSNQQPGGGGGGMFQPNTMNQGGGMLGANPQPNTGMFNSTPAIGGGGGGMFNSTPNSTANMFSGGGTGGGMFSGGGINPGANPIGNQGGGGMFSVGGGGNQQPQPNMFGGQPNAQPQTNMFGGQPNALPQNNMFGGQPNAQPQTNMFGGQPQNGMLPNSTNQPLGNMFGGVGGGSTFQQPQPQPGGMFSGGGGNINAGNIMNQGGDNPYSKIFQMRQYPKYYYQDRITELTMLEDDVTTIKCSPFDNLVAAPIWSGRVSIQEINPDQNSNQKFRDLCNLPGLGQNNVVLGCSWQAKNQLYLSDSQGKVHLWDITTPTPATIPAILHNAPVKNIVWNNTLQNLFTSSFDGTVKQFDPKSNTVVNTFSQPGKIQSMDSEMQDMGFVASEMGMVTQDLRNPNQSVWDNRNFKGKPSNTKSKDDDLNLNHQLVKIKCFPQGGGFVVGAVDGRCWIKTYPTYFGMVQQWVNIKQDQKSSFSFKSHREDPDCQPITILNFANNNVLATGSPDGSLILWEKDIRKKICKLPEQINSQKKFGNCDLVDMDFCRQDSSNMQMVVASGYSWMKGYKGQDGKVQVDNTQSKLHLVEMTEKLFTPETK